MGQLQALQWALHGLAPCTRSPSTSFSDIFVSDAWNWVEQPCILLSPRNPSKRKAWIFWQAPELVNRTTWNKCCIIRPVLHKKEQGWNKFTCMVGNRQLRYQVFPLATICLVAGSFMVLWHILCKDWKITMGSTTLTLCPDKKGREKDYYFRCSLPQFGVGESIHHPLAAATWCGTPWLILPTI